MAGRAETQNPLSTLRLALCTTTRWVAHWAGATSSSTSRLISFFSSLLPSAIFREDSESLSLPVSFVVVGCGGGFLLLFFPVFFPLPLFLSFYSRHLPFSETIQNLSFLYHSPCQEERVAHRIYFPGIKTKKKAAKSD